jgi:LEA14-like dessication related protein
LSSDRESSALAAALLVILAVVAVVVPYGYYSTHPAGTQQTPVIGSVQLRSTWVDITSLNRTGLSLNLNAVVYNPNGFGATLRTANYSVYANGHYVGSGQTTHEYHLAAQSSGTLIFPISIGWESAFRTMGGYIIGLGHITWEVKGTANIEVGGLSLSAPFEFMTG